MSKHTLDVEHHTHLASLASAKASVEELACDLDRATSQVGHHADCSISLLKQRYRADCLLRSHAACAEKADPLKYHLDVGSILMRYYDIAEGTAQEGVVAAAEDLKLMIFHQSEPKRREVSQQRTIRKQGCWKPT
jgi:hypothetical protein